MLGYSFGIADISSTYGNAEIGEQFWGSDLKCRGDEESLLDCPGRENPSCARGEVAGVTCGGKFPTTTTTTSTTTTRTPTRHIQAPQPPSEVAVGVGGQCPETRPCRMPRSDGTHMGFGAVGKWLVEGGDLKFVVEPVSTLWTLWTLTILLPVTSTSPSMELVLVIYGDNGRGDLNPSFSGRGQTRLTVH